MPKISSVEWLKELREAANVVLTEAAELHRIKGKDTPFASDAVNWADLGCTCAKWERDDEGCEGAVIEVSEASPGGAYFLCLWVSDQLAERGFSGVYVRTEW